MSVTPHMHKTGQHSKATITRASGLTETLLDAPYDFQEQQLYRVPQDGSAPDTVLRPGDTITMTHLPKRHNFHAPLRWELRRRDVLPDGVAVASRQHQ
jgi:hypothetical protein